MSQADKTNIQGVINISRDYSYDPVYGCKPENKLHFVAQTEAVESQGGDSVVADKKCIF